MSTSAGTHQGLEKVAASASAIAIAVLFSWLATRGCLFWGVPRPHPGLAPVGYGLVALTACLGAWLGGPRRTSLYLISSLVLAVLLLWQYAAVAFAYAAIVIGLSRARWRLALRMALVVGIWLSLPLLKLWLELGTARSMFGLFVYWSTLAFSGPYLLLERDRGVLKDAGVVHDALYLLAPARFLTPFVQAISPSKFHASAAAAPSFALAGRALALAVYGGVLQLLLIWLPFAPPGSTHPRPDWLASIPVQTTNGIFVYAANASGIFCGIALLRSLGFDLGSGFRWPLLSRSLAEFFRRWNYYVYEGVVTLFLYPLLARLRAFLPPRPALIVGTYASIFMGSFVLMNVLGPLALAADPAQALKRLFDPSVIGLYALYWTGIILPHTGLFDWIRPKGPVGLPRRIFQHITFLLVITLLIAAAARAGLYIL